jgi:hypothetical protein
MRGVTLAIAVVLALSAYGGALAQTAKPTRITDIKLVPLPTFEAADPQSKRSDRDQAALAGQALPWPILEVSDNGMYLVEFKSDRVWVVDSTVKVDATAKASALVPEAMNFSDQDLAGSRGYGD